MIVDACIALGTAKGNVRATLILLGLSVLLRKTKVDGVQQVALPAYPHQEIVRLDVTMEVAFGVDVFDPGNGLIGDEKDGLERKLRGAVVE